MRKSILFVILISIIAMSAFALSEESLEISTIVPEDYGIEFPEDAMHIDRLYFAFETSDGYSYLSKSAPLVINSMDTNSFRLVMLYYGNQSHDYNVGLQFEAGQGWLPQDIGNDNVPIIIELNRSNGPQDIEVENVDYGKVNLYIPPVGPRRGDKALDVDLMWDGYHTLMPGIYEADINITMTTL